MFNAQVGTLEVTLMQGNGCWLEAEVGVRGVTSANGQNWSESGNVVGRVTLIWS